MVCLMYEHVYTSSNYLKVKKNIYYKCHVCMVFLLHEQLSVFMYTNSRRKKYTSSLTFVRLFLGMNKVTLVNVCVDLVVFTRIAGTS